MSTTLNPININQNPFLTSFNQGLEDGKQITSENYLKAEDSLAKEIKYTDTFHNTNVFVIATKVFLYVLSCATVVLGILWHAYKSTSVSDQNKAQEIIKNPQPLLELIKEAKEKGGMNHQTAQNILDTISKVQTAAQVIMWGNAREIPQSPNAYLAVYATQMTMLPNKDGIAQARGYIQKFIKDPMELQKTLMEEVSQTNNAIVEKINKRYDQYGEVNKKAQEFISDLKENETQMKFLKSSLSQVKDPQKLAQQYIKQAKENSGAQFTARFELIKNNLDKLNGKKEELEKTKNDLNDQISLSSPGLPSTKDLKAKLSQVEDELVVLINKHIETLTNTKKQLFDAKKALQSHLTRNITSEITKDAAKLANQEEKVKNDKEKTVQKAIQEAVDRATEKKDKEKNEAIQNIKKTLKPKNSYVWMWKKEANDLWDSLLPNNGDNL